MDESLKSDYQHTSVKTLPKSRKEKFTALLKQMNFYEKFPQKLSFKEAVTIRQETLGIIHTTDKLPVLPYLILQKIMMCDQRCRSSLFKVPSWTRQSQPTDSDSELSNSDSDDADDDHELHPVDCILAVLHCCDDILRQELFAKLSLCKLALPFLLPNPADNSVTFLLWAMRSLLQRWKFYNTEEKKHDVKEGRIVDYKGPIVSFLRIGKLWSSKSEILNAVIGEDSQVFFCRSTCKGGYCKRNFVDGLVEMCSYFPSGKETDLFSDAVTFLNLRGDAQQHSKQLKFLQNISCVSVVFISDTNAIDYITVEILRQFAKAPGGIILLCDAHVDKQTIRYAKSLLQTLPNSSMIEQRFKSMTVNQIRKNLVKQISQVKEEKYLAISNCGPIAHISNISIDEYNEDSLVGKLYAESVMKEINWGGTKYKMLPLQGPSLWHKWAKHDKERHRHADRNNINVTEYNTQQDDEKRKVREKQLHFCKYLTPVMDCFLKHLLVKNITVRKYFLLWLKLFLDDHSRKTLTKLHAKYLELKYQLYALENANRAKDISKIREQSEKLNEEIDHASIGLEHLFCEMGQIYEACVDFSGCTVSKMLQQKVQRLPEIMADIMEEGLHAVELMDGDALHVPKLWVLAVIEKLKVVCGENAREINGGRTFVLSVLGIRSSGKSTLLNTLFGLHFNVGTGRSTRGAYIQILPLNDSLRQQINYDYLLVVDTEGVYVQGLRRKNELATFVISLADATIMNMFAEGLSDLNDILQTSLHALIRMRNIQMCPCCLFVHQNACFAHRYRQSQIEERFRTKLDRMTQAAAKVEKCDVQYDSFCQVINFDDKKHVFYIPSLWRGDPPMGSVNIGYSDNVQALKTALIELARDKRTCRCSLLTFTLRVQQMWQAVLQENFNFLL